jgi:hypothetical protein
MKKLLCGLAALPLLAGVALAQEPLQLSDKQMDKVTAGWDLVEVDLSNTSIVAVSVYQRPSNSIGCAGCYLLLNSPAISVAAAFR